MGKWLISVSPIVRRMAMVEEKGYIKIELVHKNQQPWQIWSAYEYTINAMNVSSNFFELHKL